MQSPAKQVVSVALAFYGTMSGGALLWAWSSGRANLFWVEHASPTSVFASWVGSVVFALLVVVGSRGLDRFGWARDLTRWFRLALGPLAWRDVTLLAGLSALGEELLFRGVLQREWGLWPAWALFALAHVPPRVRLLPWTVSAAAIGLPLAFCAELSGSLFGPISAHFLINLLNLRHVCAGEQPRSESTNSARERSDTMKEDDGLS